MLQNKKDIVARRIFNVSLSNYNKRTLGWSWEELKIPFIKHVIGSHAAKHENRNADHDSPLIKELTNQPKSTRITQEKYCQKLSLSNNNSRLNSQKTVSQLSEFSTPKCQFLQEMNVYPRLSNYLRIFHCLPTKKNF